MATELQNLLYPTPPSQQKVESIIEADHAIENMNKHLKAIAIYNDENIRQLKSNFVVKGSQVSSLAVDKLTAGTIGVDNIFIGSTNFEIDGLLKKIIIKDEQTTQVNTILNDAFTEPANIDYTAHVPDTGSSPTIHLDTTASSKAEVIGSSDVLKVNTNDVDGTIAYKVTTLSQDNCKITVTIVNASDVDDGNNPLQIYLRKDNNNWYLMEFRVTSTTEKIRMRRCLADNTTTLGSDYDVGAGNMDGTTWTFEFNSGTLTIDEGSTERISATNADVTGFVDVVVGWGNRLSTTGQAETRDVDTLWQLDNLSVSEVTAAAGGVTRFEAGSFGSGSSYGLKVYDASGNILIDLDGMGTDIIGNAQLSNNAVGADNIITASIVDAKIANLEWAKIDNAAIINADIVDLSASKINTGTLNAAVVTVSNLSATSINAGTLTVDGSPAISVTGSGAITFTSGGDIEMNTTSTSDFNYINFYNHEATQKGSIGLTASGAFLTIASLNNGDIFLSSSQDIFLSGGTNDDIIIGNAADNNTIRMRGQTDPETDSAFSLGASGIEWVDIWADDTSVNDLQLGNGFIITEVSEAFQGVSLNEGIVILSNDEPSKALMVISQDGNIYIDGQIRPMNQWQYNNSTRKQTSIERKRVNKNADDVILESGKWIKKKKAGYVKDPKTRQWNLPEFMEFARI